MVRSRTLAILAAALVALAACASAGVPGEGEPDRVDASEGQLPPVSDADLSSPDAAPGELCPTEPCDLHAQCGCDEGDACDLEFLDFAENEFTDQLACRGVLTPGDELAACTSPSNCAAGFQCIGGQCRRYCQTNEDCSGPQPGSECVLTRNGSQRSDDRLCSKGCRLEHPDIAAGGQDGCPSSFACHVREIGEEERPITDCRPANSPGFDQACAHRSDCQRGFICIRFGGEDGESRCRHQCAVGQECLNGELCQGLGWEIDGTEYGFCPDA